MWLLLFIILFISIITVTCHAFLSNCIEWQSLELYFIIEPVCKFTNPQKVESAKPHIIINTLYGTLLIVTVHYYVIGTQDISIAFVCVWRFHPAQALKKHTAI